MSTPVLEYKEILTGKYGLYVISEEFLLGSNKDVIKEFVKEMAARLEDVLDAGHAGKIVKSVPKWYTVKLWLTLTLVLLV
jgi:hypothetical protein